MRDSEGPTDCHEVLVVAKNMVRKRKGILMKHVIFGDENFPKPVKALVTSMLRGNT